MTLYSCTSIDKFIDSMIEKGWGALQLNEGCLTSGDWVLFAPDEKHYNYVIREKYLSEWSSAQTVRRCAKISKALQMEIDACENEAYWKEE